MTPYDAAMVGLIVAGMVWGAFKGVTWQVAGIASLVLGYIAAHALSAQLAPNFPGEPVVARSLAMLTIYLGVSVGIFFLAWLIRATLRRWKFEAYDRHLGMLLGGAEGGLLGLVATLFVVTLMPQTRGPIFASPSGRVVSTVMANLGPVIPPEARDKLAPFLTADSAPAGTDATATSDGATAPLIPSLDLSAPRSRDSAARPASLGELIEAGEKRVGKAVADKVTEDLQQATGGAANGRTIDRR